AVAGDRYLGRQRPAAADAARGLAGDEPGVHQLAPGSRDGGQSPLHGAQGPRAQRLRPDARPRVIARASGHALGILHPFARDALRRPAHRMATAAAQAASARFGGRPGRRLMRVIILAGGRGTRLAEETGARPKPMVEIGGYPLLWHLMNLYAAHGFN